EHYASPGMRPFGVMKRVQDRLPPSVRGGRQLVNHSIPVRSALICRTVQVACRVEHYAPEGPASIITIGELVQHMKSPSPIRLRRQLKNVAVAVGAAGERGSVEVSCGVEDHRASGTLSVLTPGERVQVFYGPRAINLGHQLEDDAQA